MRYVFGDITKSPEKWIVHGCNAQGVMGSGVALALRNKWPEVFRRYKDHCNHFQTAEDRMGTWNRATVDTNKHVINLITQLTYGREIKRYADPLAIEISLRNFIESFMPSAWKASVPMQIASPKIGCGFGGLDWEVDVKPIYEKLNSRFGQDVEFTIYDNR